MPSPDCLHHEEPLLSGSEWRDRDPHPGIHTNPEPSWVKVNYARLTLLRPNLTLPNTLKRKIEYSENEKSKKARKERKKEKKLKKVKRYSSPQNPNESSHPDQIPKSKSIPTIPEVSENFSLDHSHRPSPFSDNEVLVEKIPRGKFHPRKRSSRESSVEGNTGSTTKKPTIICPTGTFHKLMFF